jgi:hypothetical protein
MKSSTWKKVLWTMLLACAKTAALSTWRTRAGFADVEALLDDSAA